MTKNDRRKKATKRSKKPLITEQNRIEKLETENLELKIKLEVSKLLAYSVTAGSPNLGFALEPLNEFTSEVTGSIVQTIFAYRSGLAIPSQGMEKNVAKLI